MQIYKHTNGKVHHYKCASVCQIFNWCTNCWPNVQLSSNSQHVESGQQKALLSEMTGNRKGESGLEDNK